MKKLAIVGAVLLVVGGLGMFPARAVAGSQDAPRPSAEDQAFLATLAAPAAAPAPELGEKLPDAVSPAPRVDCNALFTQCESSCPNQCVKSFRCSPYSCVCGRPCI